MARRKPKNTKRVKVVQVIVGEGSAEKAFISHIKSLYADGTRTVRVKSAGGKGPNNVIGDAIGEHRAAGGNVLVAALLDTDLKWPKGIVAQANQKGIILIDSVPCLEGLLLTILGQRHPHPATNANLKNVVHPMLNNAPTDKASYQASFDKGTLDNARTTVPQLDSLIRLMHE